jgi:hypothetical protein
MPSDSVDRETSALTEPLTPAIRIHESLRQFLGGR